MTNSRLADIPGIGVDQMGNAADAIASTAMLRLENLDTDIPPPKEAIEATKAAIGTDAANSYLPFLGMHALREAAARRVSATTGIDYAPDEQCIVSAGGLSGILNALLAILEPGDEVIITDPAYAGLINRIYLAGGVPILVPLIIEDQSWRLDVDALRRVATNKTRVVLTMSPSMPSGIVHTQEEWDEIAAVVRKTNAYVLHDAAMERILFTDAPAIHPASLDGLADRVITVGSVSKEYRMIGWRCGWVVGPKQIMKDIGLVSLTNVVCQVGIGMQGAAAALNAKDDGVDQATQEWRSRRDFLITEMNDLPVVSPDGGWSLLVDTQSIGMTPGEASKLLFEHGEIAATPMTGWGSPQCAVCLCKRTSGTAYRYPRPDQKGLESMTIKRIETGPRMAQAVISNGHIFVAGQIGAGTTTRQQTEDILNKVDRLLLQAGSSRSHLLSANIWLADVSNFSEMNEIWDAWIDVDHPPARACVQSRLALPELKVEIAVVAQVEDKGV